MDNAYMSPVSFGDLLKTYRKQAHLTQRQLAAKLDLHYNTIWAWERGDHLPETKGLVLELARQVGLNDYDTRQLLEASLTAVSPYWQVPMQRNIFFTGRDAVLTQIHLQLCQERAAAGAQPLALCGLGGIGKTQTVLEYAYRYGQEYSAVFWISAETSERILASFTSIAIQLRLLEVVPADQYTLVAVVLQWFTRHRDWLLIVDNIEDIALVKQFLPPARYGTVLVTTRLQAFRTLAYPLKLERMTVDEGMELLLCRAGRAVLGEHLKHMSSSDITLARSIVEALDGLPLAIDQAGAYIDEVQCSLTEYLHLYQVSPFFLLKQGDACSDHPESVVRTFTLAFEQVRQRSPAAVDLLCLCAFLHADAIPEEVLTLETGETGPLLAAIATNRHELDHIVKILRHFSLVDRCSETKTLTLHRLVQVVVKESMSEELQHLWAERAVRAVNHLVPDGDPWSVSAHFRWKRGLTHSLACVVLIETWQMADMIAIRLLYQTGSYLIECAMYTEAEHIYRQTLGLCYQLLGPNHTQTGEVLNDLAVILWYQGRYREAEALYQQALAICAPLLGMEHSIVLHIRTNLAVLYYEQGKYTLAEHIFQETARIRENVLGPMHPHVAESLHGLAMTYMSQQRLSEAEFLSQHTLCVRRQVLGDEHPAVAQSLTHLGRICLVRGEFDQSHVLLQQAITIRERKQGSVHPKLAISLNVLGDLYLVQGQYEQAETFLKRAWIIREQMLPPEHPQRAESLYSLAKLFIAQGFLERAEPLLQQAREITQLALGLEHPLLNRIISDLSKL